MRPVALPDVAIDLREVGIGRSKLGHPFASGSTAGHFGHVI